MNAHFRQSDRQGELSTVLGRDTLNLIKFDATEQLNGLYTYRVDALATTAELDFDQLLGTHSTVVLRSSEHEDARFDGIVSEVRLAGPDSQAWRYELVLRPWIFLMSLRRKQQIFHNKTVVEILKEVFDAYGENVEDRLWGSYPALEYTVQYRESDLDFVRRQMERFGISFHFTHKDGAHTLVLTDDLQQHEDAPGTTRPFKGVADNHRADEEHFWSLRPGHRMTTGAIRLTDYNFKQPTAAMEVSRIGQNGYAEGQLEGYDYPGDYLDQGPGRNVARLRSEEETAQGPRIVADGDCMTLRAGHLVTIEGKDTRGAGRMACLIARTRFEDKGYRAQASDDTPQVVTEHLFMPAETPLVPERRTHKPLVQGPQTAVVVGEGEIDCDEYGRILVHFHWDLDQRYSMRCRVSQNWAGKGWGGMVIPRIGMEVVVEFLEGDPDKPLVTGCVYNGKNDVPYPLPANKTKSVFKTDTHKGGGFNELMFEDERDEELIWMHGQKDQQIDILNDRRKTIGQDQHETVGRDKSITVGQDHAESVARDAQVKVGRDVLYDVGQNQIEGYGKDHIHNVGNIHKQDIHADHLTQVGRNCEHTVLGKYSLNVNQSITNNTKTHTLMAFDKFVIKGPGGKITIDAGGITLEAAKIDLKGNVSMGGSGGAQVPTLQGAANDGLPLVEECPKPEGE